MANPLVGVINAGSSSLKFSFYEGESRILSGQIDGIGVRPKAKAVGVEDHPVPPPDLGPQPPTTPGDMLAALLPWVRDRLKGQKLEILGHRVVHGGIRYAQPARVTPELLAELEALVRLAPLHQPHNLAPIRAMLKLNPDLPQKDQAEHLIDVATQSKTDVAEQQ